ncbi:hypothetical protein HYV79_00885 [Candidatus Woesearchaeota archaeon]|nr:hypothetical protein [Candidatus Woesearchaeota archaeon]
MVKAETEHSTSTYKIKYRGYFDPNELIVFIRKWVLENHYSFSETKHKASSSSISIEVEGSRKLNEYVKYKINISTDADDIKQIELIKEGKKIKTYEGKLIMTICGTMNLDWQKRFNKSQILQFLQDFFHKYIIKEKVEDEWISPLENNAISLRNDLRKLLNIN